MIWWAWVLLGLGLLAYEVAIPGGLFALFFGVGAILVAPVAALGLSSTVQWFTFSVLSLVGLATLRGPLLRRFPGPTRRSPDIVGEVALLTGALPPGGVAKAELRGTVWEVRSDATATLEAGQRCVVERVEGLTLWVRSEQQDRG